MTTITKNCCQRKLEAELERLKKILRLGYELSVEWRPNNESDLSGKVEGQVIYIFEKDFVRALDTLRHEFFDYLVSLAIKPYEKTASYYRLIFNSLIKKLGEEAYKEKEQVIEALVKMIKSSDL